MPGIHSVQIWSLLPALGSALAHKGDVDRDRVVNKLNIDGDTLEQVANQWSSYLANWCHPVQSRSSTRRLPGEDSKQHARILSSSSSEAAH